MNEDDTICEAEIGYILGPIEFSEHVMWLEDASRILLKMGGFKRGRIRRTNEVVFFFYSL